MSQFDGLILEQRLDNAISTHGRAKYKIPWLNTYTGSPWDWDAFVTITDPDVHIEGPANVDYTLGSGNGALLQHDAPWDHARGLFMRAAGSQTPDSGIQNTGANGGRATRCFVVDADVVQVDNNLAKALFASCRASRAGTWEFNAFGGTQSGFLNCYCSGGNEDADLGGGYNLNGGTGLYAVGCTADNVAANGNPNLRIRQVVGFSSAGSRANRPTTTPS